jgi:RNA recognition motif-containing protein
MFSDDLNPGVREQSEKAKLIGTLNITYRMNNKLFVGNLSFQTTENDLNDAFAAHGSVTEANLMMDRATNRSRGFAFVTMSTDEEAQKAIAAMNGKELNGRAITVNIARPREERPAGGGGRREYGGGGGGGRGGHGGGGGGGGGRGRY